VNDRQRMTWNSLDLTAGLYDLHHTDLVAPDAIRDYVFLSGTDAQLFSDRANGNPLVKRVTITQGKYAVVRVEIP